MRKLTTRELEVLAMIGERLTVKEMAARQNVSISAVNKRIGTLKALFGVNTQRDLYARFAAEQPTQDNESADSSAPGNDAFDSETLDKDAPTAIAWGASPFAAFTTKANAGLTAHAGLTASAHAGLTASAHAGLTESACAKSHLPDPPIFPDLGFQNDLASAAVLQDSMVFQHKAPWQFADQLSEVRVVPGLLDGRHAISARVIAVLAATMLIFATILVGLGVAHGLNDALSANGTRPHSPSS